MMLQKYFFKNNTSNTKINSANKFILSDKI